jgi:hypothetical protein
MKPVKREEFEHRSDLEVLHRPTGTNVSTYWYQNPDEACSSIKVNFGTQMMSMTVGRFAAWPVNYFVRALVPNDREAVHKGTEKPPTRTR